MATWTIHNGPYNEKPTFGPKHYGVWSDQYGWWWVNGVVWFNEHECIARAQCDYIRHAGLTGATWRVRMIEEWARAEPLFEGEGDRSSTVTTGPVDSLPDGEDCLERFRIGECQEDFEGKGRG